MVTGAGGRLGRLLQTAWRTDPSPGLRLHACGRDETTEIQWDMLQAPPPAWPAGAVVLHLAGVVRGSEAALAANAALVAPLVRACRQNAACGLLFASTAAVYAPRPEAPDELVPPAPTSAYGQAKARAEEQLAVQDPGCPVVVLRLGNVVGADALLGPRPAGQPIRLDPVPRRPGGPLRSWIGPLTLARLVAVLARRLAEGAALPPVLNVAAAPPLAMADLLAASGRDWGYGPANPAVVPVAALDTARLQTLCPVPLATPAGLIAELRQVAP